MDGLMYVCPPQWFSCVSLFLPCLVLIHLHSFMYLWTFPPLFKPGRINSLRVGCTNSLISICRLYTKLWCKNMMGWWPGILDSQLRYNATFHSVKIKKNIGVYIYTHIFNVYNKNNYMINNLTQIGLKRVPNTCMIISSPVQKRSIKPNESCDQSPNWLSVN